MQSKHVTSFGAVFLALLYGFVWCDRAYGYQQPSQQDRELILSMDFEGSDQLAGLSFATGIQGMGLDLEASSNATRALSKLAPPWFSVDKDFSISIWVQSSKKSEDVTVILSNADFRANETRLYGKRRNRKGLTFFCVDGAWGWNIGNGTLHYNYEPVYDDQPISDGRWHQLVFTYNAEPKEGRLYYDGVNRASFSLGDLKNTDFSVDASLRFGAENGRSEYGTFAGVVDELRVWSKTLSSQQVAELYRHHAVASAEPVFDKNTLTVLNWNIWHGGTHYTKEQDGFDGIERTIELIRDSGADVVLMQETYGAGSKISSNLGFYYYEACSTVGAVWGANLSVMSRYPIKDVYMNENRSNYGKNYAFNNGGARVQLTDDKDILVFSNWYNGRKPQDLAGALEGWRNLVDGADDLPIVWAGDFNSVSHLDDGKGRSGHSRLMTDAGFKDSYRERYPNPKTHPCLTSPGFGDRIDFIYYKGAGLELEDAGAIVENFKGRGGTPRYPSDHLGIISKFRVR
ncbi:MAG: endonuclease/exonuclease/phosphatase family protein [Pirellulales bacterium]|nr:endonuclease/exonuclease/phosphatase family protein [Pirellulales bacterium]